MSRRGVGDKTHGVRGPARRALLAREDFAFYPVHVYSVVFAFL